jgi:multimeric flavodoxin WrbA
MMKLVILNGSPKGDTSVTMQYVRYLRQEFPDCEYVQHNVTQRIHLLEKNHRAFDDLLADVEQADGVIWAFPLYILLVHGQYKRFIELLFERDARPVFAGTCAATLSTSIHFFDHTAHRYMREISEDLGMKFVGSHSAAMHDLLDARKREGYRLFLADMMDSIRDGTPEARHCLPPVIPAAPYCPGPPAEPVSTDRRVTVIADRLPEGSNLAAMVERFRRSFTEPPELVILEKADIRGGCLGCLQCGYANRCVYEGRDGFIGLFNEKVLGSDIVVFAGEVCDRFLSSVWKTFMDRSFFRTHQPSMRGRQTAFLVSGRLSPNARQVLDAWMQMHETDLADIITDEPEDSAAVDAALDSLAARLVRHAEQGFVRERDFLGIAGTKVFRDEIWGGLKIVFQADHRFYTRHGTYDFPHSKPIRRVVVNLAAMMIRLPFIRRRFYQHLRGTMISRYQRLFDTEPSETAARS